MLPNLPSIALSIRLSKLQLLWPVYWCLLALCPLFRFMSIPEIRFFPFFSFCFSSLFFGGGEPLPALKLTLPSPEILSSARPWVTPDPLFRPCVLSLSFLFRATRRLRPTQNLSPSPRNSFVSKPSMTLAQLSYVWQQGGLFSCAAAVSPFYSSLVFCFLIW